jgi:thiol-disulfide isomerase/thioredoxin
VNLPADAALVSGSGLSIPEASLTTVDGDTVPLSTWSGHVLLVNYWASWCGPCRIEIPELLALADSLSDRPFALVNVAYNDPDTLAIRQFAEEAQMPSPLYLDVDSDVADGLGGVYAMPSTFLIGSDGRIARRITGLYPVDDLRPVVDSLITAAELRP